VSLADRTLSELLSEVAAREPALGGGTAAAVASSLAAALIEMAAAFARGRPGADERRLAAVSDRVVLLRAELLELAEADLRSYQPVLAASGLEQGSPERAHALQAALSSAAKVPLAIAAGAAELAELGAVIARDASPHLIGDATAAVLLAEAGTSAAARLVELNLRAAAEDDRLGEAQEYVQRAAAARAATVVFRGSSAG
jgi:methenyltetrahydrofolate cyclohydrolase